jgi:hypothetical protein
VWTVASSVWIDHFNEMITPQTDLLDTALDQREIGLGNIILVEALLGLDVVR